MAETDVLEKPDTASAALGIAPQLGAPAPFTPPEGQITAPGQKGVVIDGRWFPSVREWNLAHDRLSDEQSRKALETGEHSADAGPQPLEGSSGPLDLPPEAGMVIKVIRAAEGTAAGSGNLLYGGAQFAPGKEHPAETGWQGGYDPDGRPTHAAGPGQWQPATWRMEKARAAQQGIDLDFSNPQHQNWAMWDRAQEAYKRATGRDLATDVKEGKADYRALGGEWQGLLKNGGQPTLKQWANGYSPALEARANALQNEANRLRDQYHTDANELMREANAAPAGSKERNEAITKLREREREYLAKYEDISSRPPTMKPIEAMEHFGSTGFIMAGLIGLFSRRHMTAALGAMGKAMQAANQNRYEEFQREYKTWEQQSTTALNMVKLHNEEIRNLIDDKKMSVDEKNTALRFKFEALGMKRQADQMALGAAEKVFAEQASIERLTNTASQNAQAIKLSVAAQLEAKYLADGVDPAEAKTRAMREAGVIPGGAEKAQIFTDPNEKDDKGNPIQYTMVPGKPETAKKLDGSPYTPKGAQKVGTTSQAAPDPGQVEYVAKAISEYRMPPMSGWAMNKPFGQAVMARVSELNPSYQAGEYRSRYIGETRFTTGKQGDTIRSFGVSIDHLETMQEAADALANGDIQLLNQAKNKIKAQLGYEGPIDFNFVRSIVGGEVSKAIIGGIGALADREELRTGFDIANSPEQLAGVIRMAKKLMAGQLSGLRQQARNIGWTDQKFDEQLPDVARKELAGLERKSGSAKGVESVALPEAFKSDPDGTGYRKDGVVWVKKGDKLVRAPEGVETPR